MNEMKNKFTITLVGMVVLTVTVVGFTAMAADDRFSELAEQPFIENAATDGAAKTLMEELYFQRACQIYLWALPAINTVAMRDGSAKASWTTSGSVRLPAHSHTTA